MNQNEGFVGLDPKQADLLSRRVAQNEAEDIPSEIKIIEGESPEPPKDTIVQPPPEMFADKQVSQTENIKSRVRELEKEVGELSIKRSEASNDTTFKDNYGNETYYVKNVSGTHIVVSDIERMDKIPSGKVADLLVSASVEEIQNSRDIRRLLHDPQRRYLKRLTEQEYYEERERELLQEKKLKLMAKQNLLQSKNPHQQQPQQELLPHERPPVDFSQTHAIRPAIEARLGKLALKNDPNPENSKFAMTSIEFIDWVNNEPLSHTEIDYIMGDPAVSQDYNIRAALMEKKRTVIE